MSSVSPEVSPKAFPQEVEQVEHVEHECLKEQDVLSPVESAESDLVS